jgi:transcription factor IIIB subunit 2
MAGSRLMGRHMDVRDGKEASLLNARRTITQVASTLRLPPLYIDRAYRLYQLALQRNFTFGRRQTHVVATCLYIICRQEKSPHLLIDFSDALQVNVYVLGKAFLQFSRVLNLNLPVVDPSLYIHRYAGKLDFGDKMNSVVTTTLRIVTRLKKDWIAMGRRPDGVCAAALLIASRAHDFNVSQENIAVLFRIAQDTLRRRLVEFKNTPSAQLNLQQFHTHDTDVEFDPPSFINNTLAEYGDNINLNIEESIMTEESIKVTELIDDDVYKTISDSEDENDDENSTGLKSSSQGDSMNTKYKVVNLGNDIKVNVPLPTLKKSR